MGRYLVDIATYEYSCGHEVEAPEEFEASRLCPVCHDGVAPVNRGIEQESYD